MSTEASKRRAHVVSDHQSFEFSIESVNILTGSANALGHCWAMPLARSFSSSQTRKGEAVDLDYAEYIPSNGNKAEGPLVILHGLL
jgi:hypothetical protein